MYLAVQRGVAAQAVVAMHTASDIACCIKTSDCLAVVVEHYRVHIDLQTIPAVMDPGSDDGNTERLGPHGRTGEDVVVECLARTCLATSGIPGLA